MQSPNNQTTKENQQIQKANGAYSENRAQNGQTDNYVVIGNPIKHSLSPQIHQLFAEQQGEKINYSTLLVEEKNLEIAVRDFFAQEQNKGMNVTIPHKQNILAFCDILSEDAKIAGAVNTIVKGEDGKLTGHNTDGIGLVADLNALGLELKNQRLLIMGAGGATRGIIAPLLRAGIAKIYLSNRTAQKSEQIIKDFDFTDKIIFLDWQDLLENKKLELEINAVINATSMSMGDSFLDLNATIFNKHLSWSYDLFYKTEPTSFLEFCKGRGVTKTHDGLGMLIEQANEAYYLWRNKKSTTKQIKQKILELLKS